MVMGSSIGAGMMALPLLGFKMGFFFSVALLLGCCVLMVASSMLTLEVNIAMPDEANGFNVMARETLGKYGSVVSGMLLICLLYFLTIAYISGSSSLLGPVLRDFGLSSSDSHCALIFTLVLGSVVYCGTKMVDCFNRFFVFINLFLLFFAIFLLFAHVRWGALTGMDKIHPLKLHFHYFILGAPIFLSSFGFQNIIPSLRNYVGKAQVGSLRKAMVAGSVLTFLIYFLWIVVAIGATSKSLLNVSVATMVNYLATAVDSKLISFTIRGFSNFVMTASFLGVTLSLFDFLACVLRRNATLQFGRAQTALITFVPPLLFALFLSHDFIFAMRYVAFFAALLFVVFPAIMAFSLRYKQSAPGKKMFLVLLFPGMVAITGLTVASIILL